MEKISLQQTRTKLSLYFAAIVFLIVLFLGLLFLSVKYVSEYRLDNTRFINQSNNLLQELWKDLDILGLFGLDQERFDDEFIGKRWKTKWPIQLSYLVLDSENTISQKRILQDIDFKVLSWKFEPWFGKDDGVLFRKAFLDDSVSWDKVIMYMKHRFSFQDYIEDVMWYFLLSLLFGLGFYYIGLLFVGKTLTPVAENMDDMQNFIHNAGHELKTPIAVIDSNLQLLAKLKKQDPELVAESRTEVKRLNGLVEWLVDLADISSTAKTKLIDIEPEIEAILSEYSSRLEQKKIKVVVDFRKRLKLKANPGYIQMFFSNFIENAIKYNKQKWALHVSYDGDVLSISDTWVWMSKQDQQNIFDRFYQTSSARSWEGFGIGLSLVKKIADIYNWKISIESKLWKGTKFDIDFR